MNKNELHCRSFVSFSGTKLPLNLVNELTDSSRANRNTFFRGTYDSQNHLIRCEKLVYGEIDLLHEYHYHANGSLKRAEITDADGDLTVLTFDAEGNAD